MINYIITYILIIVKKKEKNKKKEKDKKKKDEETEIENEPKIHYFLLTKLDSNETYKQLLDIEPKLYFSIKELKVIPDEESMIKNNIIKVKNFFCSLLYNYHKLAKTDFDEGTTDNTVSILNELNIFFF